MTSGHASQATAPGDTCKRDSRTDHFRNAFALLHCHAYRCEPRHSMVPATPDPYVATGASSVASTRLGNLPEILPLPERSCPPSPRRNALGHRKIAFRGRQTGASHIRHWYFTRSPPQHPHGPLCQQHAGRVGPQSSNGLFRPSDPTSSGDYTTKWEKCKSARLPGCMTAAARSHESGVGLSTGLARRPGNPRFLPRERGSMLQLQSCTRRLPSESVASYPRKRLLRGLGRVVEVGLDED